jgi:aminoglycoside phosphotransferase
MPDAGPRRIAIPEPLQVAVLDAFPPSTRIVAAESYRAGYLPYPARIGLEMADGTLTAGVLKVSAAADRIAHEAEVLRALGELGLSVPTVLAGPLTIDHGSQTVAVLVLSELPGDPLPWLALTDLGEAHLTCRLVLDAVDALHALTPRVRAHPIAARLPVVTVEAELEELITASGSWLDVPWFRSAVELIEARLPTMVTPLVFSNGDYNPLNFLHVGPTLSGWVDFEAARFEDPSIGFAKFLLWADDDYGWGAGAKAGLVERYLYEHNVPSAAFLPRLILRGLAYVQCSDPGHPSDFMLQVIKQAVTHLRKKTS